MAEETQVRKWLLLPRPTGARLIVPKSSTSLLLKILTLLFFNATFVLVLGIYSLYTVSSIRILMETAVDRSLPIIKVADVVELERASQRHAVEQVLQQGANPTRQKEFIAHGERLQTFLKTLVWGSETQAFRMLEDGRYYRIWHDLGYDKTLKIDKSWHRVSHTAAEADVLYNHYQLLAAQYFERPDAAGRAALDVSEGKLETALVKLSETVTLEVSQAIATLKEHQERTTQVLAVFIVVSFLLSFAVGIWFSLWHLFKPIELLSQRIQKVAEGDLSSTEELGEGDELVDLQNAFKRMVDRLREAQTTISRKSEQLQASFKREIEAKDTQLVQSEKLASIGEMAAGLIHEINQPLNFLKIMSQGIRRNISKGRYKFEDLPNDMIEVENYVVRLADLVNEMRKFSRKSDRSTREPMVLSEALDGVLKLVGEQLRMHQIKVVKEFDPSTGPIMAGVNRLQQVFVNLLSNARDAIDERSAKGHGQITVRVYQKEEWAYTEIEDNGCGIPEDVQPRIFDAFFTTKTADKGTGLGMGIVKKIIEDFGGQISFRTQIGVGTVFVVAFKVMPKADSDVNMLTRMSRQMHAEERVYEATH